MDREDMHEKLQNDLISLMRVLDYCMSEIDIFYYRYVKQKLLSMSNDN